MIKAASLFSQILSTIRTAANFDNLVAKHEAEKNAKGTSHPTMQRLNMSTTAFARMFFARGKSSKR